MHIDIPSIGMSWISQYISYVTTVYIFVTLLNFVLTAKK